MGGTVISKRSHVLGANENLAKGYGRFLPFSTLFPYFLSFPLFMTHLFDYNMYKYHTRCNQEGVGQVRHRQENTGLTMLPCLNPTVLRIQSASTLGRFYISGFK